MSCVSASFRLHDFQGHVLNLAASINPVITFPPASPAGINEMWSLKGTALSSAATGQSEAFIVTSPSSSALALEVTCLTTTVGFVGVIDTDFVLTSWLAQTGEEESPVTFEFFTGREEQLWTFEGLD
ncbi:hypothetical protein C8R45DRAFT_1221531 [Mycena sanguinolenta]|nr:hypothetical protein C8R45DRAFT_1221531 [Mycena sanguinolenta]